MTQPTILIWGAGRIGRGFCGDLFAEAGYRLVFVEQAPALVDTLGARGWYTVVHTSGGGREDRVISGFEVLSTLQTAEVEAALAAADLVAVAVFPRDFPVVARQMVPGLLRRRREHRVVPLDVILCTNLAHAGPALRGPLFAALPADAHAWAEARIGIVESLVIRMVAEPPAEEQARDPLLVWTNGYDEFPVDRGAFKGPLPSLPGLRPVDDMRAAEMRKLYTYNTFHAALAYLGALRGQVRVVDCLADLWVESAARVALDEASAALSAAYGWPADEMERWIEGVVEQTDNPALGDTVARFGADPGRKLRRQDRLVGPLLLARQHGVETAGLLRGVAAALRYQDPEDGGAAQVQDKVDTLGVEKAARLLCGLSADEADVVEAIGRAYRRLPLEVEWAGRAEEAYRLGFDYERTYKGCGQCVLAAVQEASGLFPEPAFEGTFEAATGLAGGIGLCGDATCSAFTGGALALGLYSPRRRTHFDGDREKKYKAYDLIQRLRERFVARYGGIRCHEIHAHEFGRPFDLRDPAEREAFEAAGAHADKCTGVVARAARWVVEIIAADRVTALD